MVGWFFLSYAFLLHFICFFFCPIQKKKFGNLEKLDWMGKNNSSIKRFIISLFESIHISHIVIMINSLNYYKLNYMFLSPTKHRTHVHNKLSSFRGIKHKIVFILFESLNTKFKFISSISIHNF